MMSASNCLVLQGEGVGGGEVRDRGRVWMWDWLDSRQKWTLPSIMAARDAREVVEQGGVCVRRMLPRREIPVIQKEPPHSEHTVVSCTSVSSAYSALPRSVFL